LRSCGPAGNHRRRRAANPGIDITVIVSFNRAGDILGHPKITYESEQATENDRVEYRIAVMETFATLHADAIYRINGRRRCRPAVRCSVSQSETTTPNP